MHAIFHCRKKIFFFNFFLGQYDQYVEVDEFEKGPGSEQKSWEKKKQKNAIYNVPGVSEDKRKKQEEKEKKYDLILDDEIEFIQALKMPGSKDKDDDEDGKDLSEYEKKRMTIEETKKSLPVYPFKQSLLDAIEEHQANLHTTRVS